MNTLELFSGTQSFSKGIKRSPLKINQVITVDILDKFHPTHCVDILNWDYKIYPEGYFNIIWGSPPCTEYSTAKTRGARNLEFADSLVKKTFEIIDYFKPDSWIVENVGTGLLPDRMDYIRPNLSSFIADYCAYGKPYRKRTIFWSNKNLILETCKGIGFCDKMEGRRHLANVGCGTPIYPIKINSVWQKNSIPDTLIDSIIQQLNEARPISGLDK